MSKRKWNDQDFVEAVRTSTSYAQVIAKLHLRGAGSNYETVKRKIQELHLDTSHMTGKAWNQGMRYMPLREPQPLESILVDIEAKTKVKSAQVERLEVDAG